MRRTFSGILEGNWTTSRRIGIETAKKWRSRRSAKVFRFFVYLFAALLLAWFLRALWVVIFGGEDVWGPDVDGACEGKGVSCGAVTGFVLPWLSLALATALFLINRLWRVPRRRQKLSRTAPHQLVPTAGAISGRVVGRDELCKVVMESVRMREGRRPQLIVGGVGTGKTAVMVQLTRLLAEKKATPVAVRLRDVKPGFRFSDIASQQFQGEIHRRVLSGAEGDKIWRYLRQDDRIVVLADGLEEALSQDPDRDDHIRLAISQAKEDDLPLVIASRPHNSLRGMDASILELEPMSEEAALQYLDDGDVQGDPRRLDWIVETAGVAEAPLYLRIAHDLSRERLLSHLVMDDDHDDEDGEPLGSSVDTRNLDRSALRRNLLDTWRSALIRGRLHGQVPLSPAQRRATITFVAALACVGLREDTLEVRYDDALLPEPSHGGAPLIDWISADAPDPPVMTPAADDRNWLRDRFREPALTKWVKSELPKLKDLGGEVDTRLAATWGAQLGLVEVRGDAVRFQHSVLQAYLGSLPLATILADEGDGRRFLDRGFRAPHRPGRELLIALVLLSRHIAAQRLSGGATARGDLVRESDRAAHLVDMLEKRAAAHLDSKGLDILAAALEIDAVVAAGRRQHHLATAAAKRWETFRAADLRTLEEAKLGFVYRFGEALRAVDGRLREDERRSKEEERQRKVAERHSTDRASTSGDGRPESEERQNFAKAYRQLFRIGCTESLSYPVRHAVAQELGAGGMAAFSALRPDFTAAWDALENDGWQLKEEEWRKVVMSAWLAPLLLGYTRKESYAGKGGGPGKFSPRENLRWWMSQVGKPEVRARSYERRPDRAPPTEESVDQTAREGAAEECEGLKADDQDEKIVPKTGPTPPAHGPVPALPISIEVALAQGFKWAANRRERHPRAQVEGRIHLSDQAFDLLKRSGFWFSQLTLLHALGLWALPDNLSANESQRIPGPSSRGDYIPDLAARVHHWVEVAGNLRDEGKEPRNQDPSAEPHRFVVEAGELVIRGLTTRRPERFMWIDEHGVTSKIGASAINRAELRKHHLWIPPSIGWSALHGRAQQLVADVLLLMNLADRGDQPRSREDTLNRANRRDLPPCITQNRTHLDVNREVGVSKGVQPDKRCPGECEFDLCPYPPKGQVNYHAELTEAFCRRQQTMLGRRNRPPWQEMLPREITSFWEEMATRARR
jgi:hypothetical protein